MEHFLTSPKNMSLVIPVNCFHLI